MNKHDNCIRYFNENEFYVDYQHLTPVPISEDRNSFGSKLSNRLETDNLDTEIPRSTRICISTSGEKLVGFEG